MPQESSSAKVRRREIRQTVETRLISEPLRSKVEQDLTRPSKASVKGLAAPRPTFYEVIFEVNLQSILGRTGARNVIFKLLGDATGEFAGSALSLNLPDTSHPYVFAHLTAKQIIQVAEADRLQAESEEPMTAESAADGAANVYAAIAAYRRYQALLPLPLTTTYPVPSNLDTRPAARPLPQAPVTNEKQQRARAHRAIFRIWESQRVHPLTTESIQTVKARPAHNSFGALGDGIVWAVLDSGVDASHQHFKTFDSLDLSAPLTGKSYSFKPGLPWDQDGYGHGTHVAGIICGQAKDDETPKAAIQAEAVSGDRSFHLQDVQGIRGMAPKAKLLILRVLDDMGNGTEADLIQAIEYIQQLNDYGRHVVVHGANISVGLFSDPTWYACGQTPLCREINRLVKSGVVVVAAAGNTGYGASLQLNGSAAQAGQSLSINDPGNADLAVTVGSTHRSAPHTFGVSYFSSKGPTCDGRLKPDVVAPGEKIISAASSQKSAKAPLDGLSASDTFGYMEDTGTSMAAPHVSGVLAAFLSVKREFIGEPEKTRELLKQSAVDLGRERTFQGAGLVDLLKLIQSV